MVLKGKKCSFCDRPAVEYIGLGDAIACADHYVLNFDESYIVDCLLEQATSSGKIRECKEVQLALKKRFPQFYEQFKDAFEV